MPNAEREPGTNPEIPSAKREAPMKPEFSADLLEELGPEGERTPEEPPAAAAKERPAPSPVDQVVSSMYDALGNAKLGRDISAEGGFTRLSPTERLAGALAVRENALDLIKLLKEREELTDEQEGQLGQVARDAEMLAAISPQLFGVDATNPEVQAKLTELKNDYAERERALLEEVKRMAADQEAKRKVAEARMMADRAVSKAQIPSLADSSLPSPFGESIPSQEPTAVGLKPLDYVEDQDILGSAEDFDEMNVELGGAETELAVLMKNADVPGRTERLQELLDKAEKLSMRAAEAGQAEPLRPLDQKEVSPQMKAIQDLDLRATQLLLRTREALNAVGAGETTVSDYVRPVRESQLSPLESAETDVQDVFEHVPEPTVVTGQVPEVSVGPNEATRIRQPVENTVVTAPPTEEEPPTVVEKAA